MSGQFYAFKCNSCGRWCAKETNKDLRDYIFKCTYCRKSIKFNKKNQFGLSLKYKGPFELPQEATVVVIEENGKRHIISKNV